MIATATAAAARQGELFRDVGVSLATTNRRELIDADELRFLRRIGRERRRDNRRCR